MKRCMVVCCMVAVSLFLMNSAYALTANCKLNLNAEQITKLKTIKSDAQKAVEEKVKDLRDLRAELEEVLSAEDIDDSDVEQLVSEMVEIRAEIEQITLDAKIASAQVLTEAQRDALLNCKKNLQSQQQELKKYLDELLNYLKTMKPSLG